jgi:two-component system KDP operon response regulator KdpE
MVNQAEITDLSSDHNTSDNLEGADRVGADSKSEADPVNNQIQDLAMVFDNLLGSARQLSAAIQGNLQAVTGNIQSWNPEVSGQILKDTRDDLLQLSKYLDMGLIYSNVIRQISPFKISIRLKDLIEEIVNELGYTTVNIGEIPANENGSYWVKIDPDLMTIALRNLLKSVVDRSPIGQNFDIQLSEKDGFVVVNLGSPRILLLPGLVADDGGKAIFEMDLEVFLANEILTAQGGDLVIKSRSVDEGGGLEIEIYLPVAEAQRMQPIHQDWREELGSGSERILLAEAQPEYQLPIREALAELGYRVDLAVEGSAVLDSIQSGKPKLVILARDLPGMDGLLVTQGVRRWSPVPIIMISRRDSADDLLYAYRLGVDDYLKKPFLIEELLAKARVLLTRSEASPASNLPDIYQEGTIRIDQGTRQIWVRGELVQLTPIEYNLLVYLSRQGRQIIPYEQLLEQVWEGPEKGTRQGLFVHVRRLREKIEEDPKNPKILRNKWGVGYEFNP